MHFPKVVPQQQRYCIYFYLFIYISYIYIYLYIFIYFTILNTAAEPYAKHGQIQLSDISQLNAPRAWHTHRPHTNTNTLMYIHIQSVYGAKPSTAHSGESKRKTTHPTNQQRMVSICSGFCLFLIVCYIIAHLCICPRVCVCAREHVYGRTSAHYKHVCVSKCAAARATCMLAASYICM